MLVFKAVEQESIPSTIIPLPGGPGALHLLSTQVPAFLSSELPDGCPGPFYDILSSNLLVDAACFEPACQLLQFFSEKSVLELG